MNKAQFKEPAKVAIEFAEMGYEDESEIPRILRVEDNETAVTGLFKLGVEGVPVQPPAAGAETTGTSLVTTSELTDVTPVSITEEITIEDFTKKYEISVQVFQELNKNDLPKDGKLKAGDVFFIPSK